MGKKTKIIIASAILIVILFISIICILSFSKNNAEVQSISSEKQLLQIYEGDKEYKQGLGINLLTMPFSFLINSNNIYYSSNKYSIIEDFVEDGIFESDSISRKSTNTYGLNAVEESTSSTTTDYSTTNIHVENVDEADIVKMMTCKIL